MIPTDASGATPSIQKSPSTSTHEKENKHKKLLWDSISVALHQTISLHGPITRMGVNSAIKRVAKEIIENEELKSITPEDEWNKLIVDTLQTFHTQELISRGFEMGKLIKELKQTKHQLHLTQEQLSRISAEYGKVDELRKLRGEMATEVSMLQSLLQGKQLRTARHLYKQMVQKLAYRLWVEGGRVDGHADSDWTLAEKLTRALLNWKPDGVETFYEELP